MIKNIFIITIVGFLFGCTYVVEFTPKKDGSFLMSSKYTKANGAATFDNGTLKTVNINMMKEQVQSPLASGFNKLLNMGMWPLGQYLGRTEGDNYTNEGDK